MVTGPVIYVTTAGLANTYVQGPLGRYGHTMPGQSRARTPDVWAHFDRYFATAEVRGSGADAVSLICVSRWSPRHDWQVIKVEIRDLEAAKYERLAPPVQRIERRPKAALPVARRVKLTWFPAEAELDALRPISIHTLSTFGPEIRAVVTQHILAYGLIEDTAEHSPDQVVALTARRYRQLTNIGETSPAAAIAQATGTSVRTIHNRIRLARERGLLPAAGSGRRRLDPVEPSAQDMRLVSSLIDPVLDLRPARNGRTRPARIVRPRGRAPLSRVR